MSTGHCPHIHCIKCRNESLFQSNTFISSADLDEIDDTSGLKSEWQSFEKWSRVWFEMTRSWCAVCTDMERHREDCIRNQTWISTATHRRTLLLLLHIGQGVNFLEWYGSLLKTFRKLPWMQSLGDLRVGFGKLQYRASCSLQPSADAGRSHPSISLLH